MKKVLAIDPSSKGNNGLCLKEDGKITLLRTANPIEVIDEIRRIKPTYVVCEDSRIGGTFGKRSPISHGVLNGTIKIYETLCKMEGIYFIPVRPAGFTKQADGDDFKKVYPQYVNKTNDERAAVLIMISVKLPGIK